MAKKNYVMKDKGKVHVFTGDTPRQAALKAATRGFKDIKLRERGRRNKDKMYSVHVFKGNYKTVNAPANRPAWLPAKVKKPVVKKVKVEHVKKLP